MDGEPLLATECGDLCERRPARARRDGHHTAAFPALAIREPDHGRFGDPRVARLSWRPQATVELTEDQATTLLKLLDVLDDNDDVQQVAGNYEIPDDVMAKLSA